MNMVRKNEAEDLTVEHLAEQAPVVRPSTSSQARHTMRRVRTTLDRFSGIYVIIVLIGIFGVWVPDTFLTVDNARIIAGDQAITAMLALGLTIPLATGVFDLSAAGIMGFVVTISPWMQDRMNAVLAVGVVLLIGAVIGALNGGVVVVLNVDSFIATLAMSSILAGAAYWATSGQVVSEGFSKSFLRFGREPIFGLPVPVYYMVVLAVVLWYVLEFRPVGRNLYAVGGNPQASRLAGIRVNRMIFGSLVMSGLMAALAGVVLAAKLGIATQSVGPPYLLPAFTATFLGSTQVKPGRFNVLGTIIAIFVLAVGVKGLQLAGAPAYIDSIFNGVVLITAVALAARNLRRT